MAEFRYQALDADDSPASGVINAADLGAARALLASRGLRVMELAAVGTLPGERLDGPAVVQSSEPPQLPPEDARQLAEHLATLARAGLPLPPGLRAAAAETSDRRMAAALVWLAERLEAGRSLDEALAEHPSIVPDHVRRLITAGVRSGRLAQVLDELVEIDRQARDMARSVWLAVAYPLLLSVLFAALFTIMQVSVVPDMLETYEGFNLRLPWQTALLTQFSGMNFAAPVGILLAALPMLYLVARVGLSAQFRRRLVLWIPLVGPAERWRSVAGWSRLLALLLDHGIPAPDALRLASGGTSDALVRAAGRGSAQSVTAGRPLADALAATRRLPTTLIPLVRWGEASGTLPAALRNAAEMFETRVRLRVGLMQTVFPPIIFVLIALGALMLFVAFITPLFDLVSALSGGM